MLTFLLFHTYALLSPEKLLVEYRTCSNEPLVGVDNFRPRFTFQIGGSPIRGEQMEAYRVKLLQGANLIWDSGRVVSNSSAQIQSGLDLKPETQYSWTAQWWSSASGTPSAPSKSCVFETGVTDWDGAVWIGHQQARVLQYRFNLSDANTIIRAYVASPGGYVVRLNGNGDERDKGISVWTNFNLTVMYTAYALNSSLLHTDRENVFEVEIGASFWGYGSLQVWPYGNPTALIKLVIGYKKVVSSPNGWRGAVVRQSYDDPFYGATLDWREKDVKWTTDIKSEQYPDSQAKIISLNRMPRSGAVGFVNPMSAKTLSTGSVVVTFERMFVGYARLERLSITGPAGSIVTIVAGELLLTNGSCCILPANRYKKRYQTDIHTLGKSGNYSMSPLFTWYGFQYVELRFSGGAGMSEKAVMEGGVVGVVINMDMRRIGSVGFSDGAKGAASILSQLEVIVMNGLRSNLVAYLPTDCPTREKKGWLGDALNTVELAMMTHWTPTIHSFFVETMITDNQGMNVTDPGYGWIPDSVPTGDKEGKPADLSWTMAFPLITYQMLRYYNDTQLAASLWPRLTLFVDSMTKAGENEPGGLPDFYQFGDWSADEPRNIYNKGTGPTMAAANYLMALNAMSEMAEAIGNAEDAVKYSNLHVKLAPVFHSRFYTPTTKSYNHNNSNETQSLNSIALGAGLVPGDYIQRVQESLTQNVRDRDYHLSVGATGAMYLLKALNNAGDPDAAMRVATQTTFPSWGYWLAQNATTCWENWSGVKDPSHPPLPTHNHIFLCGGFGSWLYQYLAGVRPLGHGYSVVEIAPETGSAQGPDRASIVVETIRGEVKVTWLVRDAVTIPTASLELIVEVPYTARAIVRVPIAGALTTIDEDICGLTVWGVGQFFQGCPGVDAGALTDKYKVSLEVGPGKYKFIVMDLSTNLRTKAKTKIYY